MAMVHASGQHRLQQAMAQEARAMVKMGWRDLGEEMGGGVVVVVHGGGERWRHHSSGVPVKAR